MSGWETYMYPYTGCYFLVWRRTLCEFGVAFRRTGLVLDIPCHYNARKRRLRNTKNILVPLRASDRKRRKSMAPARATGEEHIGHWRLVFVPYAWLGRSHVNGLKNLGGTLYLDVFDDVV